MQITVQAHARIKAGHIRLIIKAGRVIYKPNIIRRVNPKNVKLAVLRIFTIIFI